MPQMTDEEMRGAVRAAREQHTYVVAHAGSSAAIRQAIDAGILAFEHGYSLDDETAALMADAGAFLTPTLCVTRLPEWMRDHHFTEEQIDKAMETGPEHLESIRRAVRAGVTLVNGTDYPPGEPSDGTVCAVRELEFMVEAGLSPLEALQASTINAARLCRIDGKTGAVEPGLAADLIAFDGDPTADASAVRGIRFVMFGRTRRPVGPLSAAARRRDRCGWPSTSAARSSTRSSSTSRREPCACTRSRRRRSILPRACSSALRGLGSDLGSISTFIHGTTLGLNSILERRGAPTGIITNDGFRDIFEVARGDVPPPKMYDFQYERPPLIVPRRRALGVPGRIDYSGSVVEELDEDAVRDAARALVEEHGVRSVAVAFLHAYANPEHERRAAAVLRAAFPDLSISVSSDIAREYREYERTSTAVLDAYIRPIFERYVGELEDGLGAAGFRGSFLITRSGGGAMASSVAKQAPLLTVLSGPAGGIIGASAVASLIERRT